MGEHLPRDPDAGDRFVRLDDGDMHVVENGKPGAPALPLIHGGEGPTTTGGAPRRLPPTTSCPAPASSCCRAWDTPRCWKTRRRAVDPGWRPTLPTAQAGRFGLADLLAVSAEVAGAEA